MQLDLFGPPPEAPVMEIAAPAAAEKETFAIVEEVVVPPPVMQHEEKEQKENIADKPVTSEPVVFADERIVVKIKPKTTVKQDPVTVAVPEEPTVKKEVTVQQEKPVVAAKTKTSTTISRSPGKRGRKSFKEIDSEIDLICVPDEEILKQKLYYSISEVAGWFKVNTSLLRYWENEFDILQPRKTRKGDRLFRAEDIKNLQLIYYLLRQRKFSIEGARNYLKTNKKKVDTQTQLVQSLTRFRSFLLELKVNLSR